jgi:hypothetical protein
MLQELASMQYALQVKKLYVGKTTTLLPTKLPAYVAKTRSRKTNSLLYLEAKTGAFVGTTSTGGIGATSSAVGCALCSVSQVQGLVFVGGQSKKGCAYSTAEAERITSNVVVVERGSCSIFLKVSLAMDHGAAAIVVVDRNHRSAAKLTGTADQMKSIEYTKRIPVVMISSDDAAALGIDFEEHTAPALSIRIFPMAVNSSAANLIAHGAPRDIWSKF